MKISRTLTVKLYKSNDAIYVSTRDICAYLEIKQPFEFSKQIKKTYPDSVIKGCKTLPFRPLTETSRATYIEGRALLDFLQTSTHFSLNKKFKEEVIIVLSHTLNIN